MEPDYWTGDDLIQMLIECKTYFQKLISDRSLIPSSYFKAAMNVASASKTVKNGLLEYTEIVPTVFVHDILEKFGPIPKPLDRRHEPFRTLEFSASLIEEVRCHFLMWKYKKTLAELKSEARESLISALMPYQKHYGNEKPKSKSELQKAMLPWQLKYPKIVTWEEMYQKHLASFAAYEQKTVTPTGPSSVTPKATPKVTPKPAPAKPSSVAPTPKPTAPRVAPKAPPTAQPRTQPTKFTIPFDDLRRNQGPKEVVAATDAWGVPWKTRAKIEDFGKRNQWDYTEILQARGRQESDTFDMQKQRKLMKHWYGSRYTFVIDYMFAGHNKDGTQWGYLLAINVNTRKAFWALPSKIRKNASGSYTVQKHLNENMEGAIESLKTIMKQTPVKHLMSDQEKAFGSKFQAFLQENGITHRFYVKNQMGSLLETQEKNRGNHSFTSLVDRLIRTLRTMAYLLTRKEEINPELMEYLVDEYNNSPHSTLQKYLGRPATPNEVDADVELENRVVLGIIAENHIVEGHPEYPVTQRFVHVYNDAHSWDKVKPKLLPGTFEVVGKDQGLYELKQGDHRIKVNRWMIKSE